MTELMEQLEAAAGAALEHAGPGTVAIGRAPRGSGIVVAPGRVLTNAHNLRDRSLELLGEPELVHSDTSCDARAGLAGGSTRTGRPP